MKKLKSYRLFELNDNFISKDNNEEFLLRAKVNMAYMMEHMIDKKLVDINYQNTDGRTALMIAADYCKNDALNLLIKKGANLDLQDNYGYTAIMNSYLSSFEILLNAGANLSILSNDGLNVIDLCGSEIRDWLSNNYKYQKLIFNRAPELYPSFIKYKIEIHSDIKKEFSALQAGTDLNLL